MMSHRAAEAPVQIHKHTANGHICVQVCGTIRGQRSILAARRFEAAAHVQRCAGDEIRLIRGQRDDCPGGLFGATEALQRHLAA
jgi:hypothetical protein